ncbi:MAG: hypothetical protein M3N21_00785 [Actinomycetota bacterium]|nr:hypothetical protein [Actinomycetota bacterium]
MPEQDRTALQALVAARVARLGSVGVDLSPRTAAQLDRDDLAERNALALPAG